MEAVRRGARDARTAAISSNGTQPSPTAQRTSLKPWRGELRLIVLQMHMEDSRGRPPREFDRIFANREWVSGIERDADVRSGVLRDGQELLASEILMVFDGQPQTRVGGARRLPPQRPRACSTIFCHPEPQSARRPSSTGVR